MYAISDHIQDDEIRKHVYANAFLWIATKVKQGHNIKLEHKDGWYNLTFDKEASRIR